MPTYFPRQSHNAGGGCWKGVGSGLCWKDSRLLKSERRTTAFAVLRDVKVVVSTIGETSFRLFAWRLERLRCVGCGAIVRISLLLKIENSSIFEGTRIYVNEINKINKYV